MSQPGSLKIENERLLTLAGNLLHGYFVKANKDLGKKRFKEIDDGKTVKLGSLGDKDGNQNVDLNLRLDASEFQGHLTFHLFSQALTSMLQNFHQYLSNKKKLPLFINDETRAGIFLIPGVVEENEQVNMLVLGVEGEMGKLHLNLQFIDPDQFKTDQQAANE